MLKRFWYCWAVLSLLFLLGFASACIAETQSSQNSEDSALKLKQHLIEICQKLEQRNEQLQKALNDSNQSLVSLKKSISEFQNEIQNLRADLQKSKQDLQTQTLLLQEYNKELIQVKELQTTAENYLMNLEKAFNDYKAKVDAQIAAYEAEIRKLKVHRTIVIVIAVGEALLLIF